MLPTAVVENLEQIDVLACRARAVVAVMLLHYCTPLEQRHSEFGDDNMIGVLETLEEALIQIRATARIRQQA